MLSASSNLSEQKGECLFSGLTLAPFQHLPTGGCFGGFPLPMIVLRKESNMQIMSNIGGLFVGDR
jgi:hypothetical protein